MKVHAAHHPTALWAIDGRRRPRHLHRGGAGHLAVGRRPAGVRVRPADRQPEAARPAGRHLRLARSRVRRGVADASACRACERPAAGTPRHAGRTRSHECRATPTVRGSARRPGAPVRPVRGRAPAASAVPAGPRRSARLRAGRRTPAPRRAPGTPGATGASSDGSSSAIEATSGASVPYRRTSRAGAATSTSSVSGAAPTRGSLRVRLGPADRPPAAPSTTASTVSWAICR